MAKRKATKIPDEPAVDVEFYHVGVWSGIPQYRCKWCAFDTLEKASMLEHLFETHGITAEGYSPPGVPPAIAPAPVPQEEVFEVQLKEIGQSVDADGNVHKQFTIKE